MSHPWSARLRRLDERLVPAAAAALRRMIDASATVLRAPRGPGAALDAARRAPVVVVAVLVVAAGAAILVATTGSGAGSPPPTGRAPVPQVAALGPVPGGSVADYLRNAAHRVRHLGETAPGRPTYAVVDLHDYQTPGEAATVFHGVDVVRVYARVPARRLPTQVHVVPVDGITRLPAGLRTAAAVASATARSYAVLVRDLHPRTAADRGVKARYAAERRAAAKDARAFAHPARCRCVFALVVHATFAQIAALLRAPVVRVADPAPPTVPLDALTVFPLEPGVTGAVPRPGLHG